MESVWFPFFAAVSAAAVTAVSVLFITFQLRLSNDSEWAGPRKRSTMISGLTELWVPLALTLMALMPYWISWQIGSIVAPTMGLLVIGYVWKVHFAQNRLGFTIPYSTPAGRFDQHQLWFSWVSVFVYTFMIAMGIVGIAAGAVWPLYVVAALCIWLLISGVWEAWHHFKQ